MLKLYFLNTWNIFSDAIPCNWEIIKLNITHKEGHVAKASLKVAKFSPPKSAYLAIFEDNTLLFQGMLSGQFEYHNEITTIDVLSIAPSFADDLEKLLQSNLLEYNQLFFQGKQPKACDHLEAINQLFYWNRTSGALSLSNYFKGRRCIDIGGNYLQSSLQSQQINMPFGKVIVHLHVLWTQSLEGAFNAAPYIARAFPNGVIATLTPQALTNNWPKPDQRLGEGRRQSGYQVDQANLTPINATQTVGGALASHTQPLFYDQEKTTRCKINYFKPNLKISWHYHQAREEKLLLQGVLNHEQHQFTQHKIRHIPIAIHLQPSQLPMFFETSQGKDFISYASKIAETQLKASARCIRVVCKLPWNVGRDLTVDDSLKLKTLHADIIGKITQVKLLAEGLQRFVEVTLGCVIGKGNLQEAHQTSPALSYSLESWDETVYSSDSLQGIPYLHLNPKDLIEHVAVQNHAAEQENYLLLNQFPVRDNLAHALSEVPTSIHLKLRDLRTQKPLVRNFAVTLPLVDSPAP